LHPDPGVSKALSVAALAALALLAAACGDEVTDPDALADSAEAEAVLRSAAALPALPRLIDLAGDPPDRNGRLALYRAQELWAAGVATDDDRGRARRRLAARYAVPPLVEGLEPADWEDAEAGLLDWIATAESLLQHIALPGVETRLAAARVQLDRAAATSDERARATALLLAGAELVETTPRFLARSLAADADAAVGRAQARAPDPGDADLLRAARLKDWAARAVTEGDYLMAIQRAYYALQLVEAK
jgi:hypothetical protein